VDKASREEIWSGFSKIAIWLNPIILNPQEQGVAGPPAPAVLPASGLKTNRLRTPL